jgi:hypothetical protein
VVAGAGGCVPMGCAQWGARSGVRAVGLGTSVCSAAEVEESGTVLFLQGEQRQPKLVYHAIIHKILK